jgi:hypothetical protein
LQRAASFANVATREADRLLPEEAFIAEGNAHEDLAQYYKLRSHYGDAISAFKQAIEASGVLRSPAYAWNCKGRCEFRAALDAGEAAGDLEKRRLLFRQSFASLSAAIAAAGPTGPRYLAEAHWWLGQLSYASALYGPGDLEAAQQGPLVDKTLEELRRMLALEASRPAAEAELRTRFKVWGSARQHFQTAAVTAEEKWKPEWPLILRDGLQAQLNLTESLRSLGEYAPELNRSAILEGIAADAQKLLALAQKEPDAVGAGNAASAVALLAAAKKELPVNAPAGPQAALEVFRQNEELFNRQEDAWRAQRVEVILQQARCYTKSQIADAEKDISRAEEVARAIQDGRLAMQARGNCARNHADIIYEAVAGEFASSKPNSKVFLRFDEAQRLYMQAEATLASADDPRTERNMALLRSQNFTRLENNQFKPDLTELEIYWLRKFIARTRQMRLQASIILTILLRDELVPQHMHTKFSSSAAPYAQNFRELLTPVAFLGKQIPPDLRTILTRVDHKLAIDSSYGSPNRQQRATAPPAESSVRIKSKRDDNEEVEKAIAKSAELGAPQPRPLPPGFGEKPNEE